MTQEAVERVLGRLLTDDRFRQQAKRSLAAACRSEGYLLSSEELRCIGLDDLRRLEHASALLDQRIKSFRLGD